MPLFEGPRGTVYRNKENIFFSCGSIISILRVLDRQFASDVSLPPVTIASLAAHFPSVIAEHEQNELDDQWRSY